MSTDITVRPVAPAAESKPAPDHGTPIRTKKEETAEVKKGSPPGGAKEVADGLQRLLKKLNTELRLEVRKDSGDVVIKIVDPETRKVLKQIPSEEMEHIRERMSVMAGVLLRTKS